MTSRSMVPSRENLPSLVEDMFKPFNEWFDGGNIWGRMMKIPAVNIAESKDNYTVSLAVPGMHKEDFNIDVDGHMITISCEKEESQDDKQARYSRREYSFSSFSRSFTIPEDVIVDKIDARYENGVLNLVLPKKEEAKKSSIGKHIPVK